jgi:hypothetical protein
MDITPMKLNQMEWKYHILGVLLEVSLVSLGLGAS